MGNTKTEIGTQKQNRKQKKKNKDKNSIGKKTELGT